MDLSHNAKVRMSVLIPEYLGAPAATLGAVYCSERFLPKEMTWLKKVVAKHIVEPHLAFFDKMASSLRHAHQAYDQRVRAEKIARGEPVEPVVPETPKEHAYNIADVLVKAAVALTGDFIATYGLQKLLNRAFKIDTVPAKTAFVEASVHLGGIALMPTAFAAVSEHIHYSVSNLLHNTTSMSKQHADDLALPFTYVTLPGLFASLVSLKYAHGKATGR